MEIKSQIQQLIQAALKAEFHIDVEAKLERPADATKGDFSTNVAMVLAKQLEKSPVQIAQTLVDAMNKSKSAELEKVEVAGPGFINFYFSPEFLAQAANEMLAAGAEYGKSKKLAGKRIMVEFAHPNPFKAFHIGHLRNIILGESINRLLEAQAAEVLRVNYQGDVGMHIAKCLWSLRTVDPKDYPKTADQKVALLGKHYALGATAFEEDPAAQAEIKAINKKIYTKEDEAINKLWDLGKEWSLEKFHEIYTRVGTSFLREYMESEIADEGVTHCREALAKGILAESKGAIIFPGEKYDLDTRVFINSEGLPTYEGKELGLAYHEFTDYGQIDLCIHNVAVEQISFFKVTFKVEELLDPEMFAGKQYHNAYEFVGLKSGKMSSRKGQVVLGNDILNEAVERINKIIQERDSGEVADNTAEKIGVGAVKYSFLKISPFKYLAFDMEASLNFEGDSGPYIQYAYVRAKSILDEAKVDSSKLKVEGAADVTELDLIRHLAKFPEIVELAAAEYSPHYIAGYVLDLVQLFGSFYAKLQILKAGPQERENRLAIVALCANVIKQSLYLLGIEVVDKM